MTTNTTQRRVLRWERGGDRQPIASESVTALQPLVSPTRETPEEESKIKDIWDAFRLGATEMGHRTKQYFQSVAPEFLFRERTVPKAFPARTPEQEREITEFIGQENIKKKEIRETFKVKYEKAQQEHDAWLKSHPELQPRPEWAKGTIETIKENPKVLLDPAYIGFVAAESAAYTLAFLGTTLAVTGATGNPLAGLAAGVAVTTPAASQTLFEDLTASGATPEQAANLSVPIGALISSIEVVGAFPLLKQISKPFSDILTRNIRQEVAKRTVAGLVKKGIKVATQVEIAEVMEEIAQGAIQDATVKTFDKNRDLLEGIPETAVRTAIATLPFAALGGGAGIARDVRQPTAEAPTGVIPAKPAITPKPTIPSEVTPVTPPVGEGVVPAVPEVVKSMAPAELENVTNTAFNKIKRSKGRGGRAELTSQEIEALRLFIGKNADLEHRFAGKAYVGYFGDTEIILGVFTQPEYTQGTPSNRVGGQYLVYDVDKNTFGSHSTNPAMDIRRSPTGKTRAGLLTEEEFESRVDDWIAGKMPFPRAEVMQKALTEGIPQPPTAPIEPESPVLNIPPELPTEPPPITPTDQVLGRTPSSWGGSMVDLQDAQTVSNIVFRDDYVRGLVNNIPAVRNLAKILNPSAVANTPAERTMIIRAVLRDESKGKTQGVIAHLEELGTQSDIFGNTDHRGLIASGKLAGQQPNDIRSNPSKYDLTTEQKQWVERANDIEEAKLDFLKRNGIEIKELSFEDGGRYAGRRVWTKVLKDGDVVGSAFVGSGRIGAKLASEKTRVFKTAKEATEVGYRYITEDEALFLNVKGAYNRVADKQASEWLLTQVPWRTTGASEELKLAAESANMKKRHSQQLLASLNRAVRGERVPDATINAIAGSYPAQAQILRDLIPQIQAGAPTAKTVQNLDQVARGLIVTDKANAQRAVNARARSRERAMKVGFEEAAIPHPAFAGKILTGEDAKATAETFRKTFDAGLNEALAGVNKANAVSRYFMLAGDVSPMAIQLIFLMGENPKIHAKSFAGLTKALFDPKFHSAYLAKNKDIIDKHPNLLLTKSGATEFTEATARGGWLSGDSMMLPEAESYWKNLALILPRLAGKAGAIVLSPFARGFETSLDIAGIELAKAYDYMATTPEATADVDQFINEFRGVTNSARLGVSPLEQQIETTAILAPKYNRAIAGLLFDLGRGGIRGKLARQSMIRGISALSIIAILISIARGEEPEEILDHFNPRSPNFFTWDIAGQRIGPGSKVRSVIKVIAQSTDNPESLLQFSMDNPILRFARGNMAPVPGAGLDLLTGRSYIGDPTRDGLMSFSKEILASNLLPIWVQTVLLEGGDLKGRTVRGVTEFFGGRAYPEGLWGEISNLRDKYAKADYKVKYEDLNRAQVDKLKHNHPDLKDAEDKAGLESAAKGDELNRWMSNSRIEITQRRNEGLERAAVALNSGMMSKKDYDNQRKYIRPYYSGEMATLWSARETLDEFAIKQIEKWMGENQKPEDKALDDYHVFRNNLIGMSDIPRDWDTIESKTTAYLARLSSSNRAYVLANKDGWINDLPPAAQAIERQRLAGIEDESWWSDYSGVTGASGITRRSGGRRALKWER